MTYKIDGALPAARPPDAASTSVAARAGGDRDRAVSAVAAVDSIRLTDEAEGLQALERQLGAAPAGIDVTRVNDVRAAIADGSYAIDPQQIASRMLALDRALGN